MNPSTPPNPSPDPQLTSLLRTWTVPTEVPPGFHASVWRRVQQTQASPATHPRSAPLWRWLVQWMDDRLDGVFQGPLAAPTALALLLLAGLGAGAIHGRASSVALTAGLQQRYVQSIDPYAARPR